MSAGGSVDGARVAAAAAARVALAHEGGAVGRAANPRALRSKLSRRRCCSAALSPSAPRTAKGLCVPKTLG